MTLLGLAQGRVWHVVRVVWLVIVAHGCVTNTLHGVDRARRDHDDDRGQGAGFALRLVAPEPVWLDLLVPGGGTESFEMLSKLEAHGCFQIATIRSENVADAPLDDGAAKGAITGHQAGDGSLVIDGWCVMSANNDSADAVVISAQSEGGPETWFGIAQRRARVNKLATKLGSRAFSNRIGWIYQHGVGLGRNLYGEEVRFRAKPLPQGNVIFRAYAFDVSRGKLTRLEGEVAIKR